MPLNSTLVRCLSQAIQDYDFPCVVFDFELNHEVTLSSMTQVEAVIRGQLLSESPEAIRNGLANVLYWGHARTGYRKTRVDKFRNNVTEQGLCSAGHAFRNMTGSGLRQIAHLGLPEFSGLSFVSKVRMFLDPVNYVVFDLQLSKLREQVTPTVFHEVQVSGKPTSIRVSRANELVYEKWSSICAVE